MDAYNLQYQMKQAWSTIAIEHSQTGVLTKHWPEIPVMVTINGEERTVVDLTVKDQKIYLELK
jgi:hypothetical protein